MSSERLKPQNLKYIIPYVMLHAVVLAWILSGMPTDVDTAGLELTKLVAPTVAMLLALLLNSAAPDKLKYVVVTWRWSNPEPGSRAFSALAPKDNRFSLADLEQALGNPLPTDESEQNRVWYGLYKQHSGDGNVAQNHLEWLLTRDLTWLSLCFACLGTGLLAILGETSRATFGYGLGSCCAYLLFNNIAHGRGNRFVTTVMASAAADTSARRQLGNKPHGQ